MAFYLQLVRNCPFLLFSTCCEDEQKAQVSGDSITGRRQGCLAKVQMEVSGPTTYSPNILPRNANMGKEPCQRPHLPDPDSLQFKWGEEEVSLSNKHSWGHSTPFLQPTGTSTNRGLSASGCYSLNGTVPCGLVCLGLLWGLWELWGCGLASTNGLLGLGLKGHIFLESFIFKTLFLFYVDGCFAWM